MGLEATCPNQKEGEREQRATKIDERLNAVYSI